jgi:hypothetical protein
MENLPLELVNSFASLANGSQGLLTLALLLFLLVFIIMIVRGILPAKGRKFRVKR